MSNRLLPQQFGRGTDISATRIEQALGELVRVYNDVPAGLVQRRWCPSHFVAGYSPSQAVGVGLSRSLPWMRNLNATGGGFTSTLQPPTTFQNPQRVKSCVVPTVDDGDIRIWEVSLGNSRPVIISSATMFAEWQTPAGPPPIVTYTNNWVYGAAPPADPPGLNPGDPTTDFTFQVCVDDGWDMENRRKLRQEALIWRFRSDAFFSNPNFAVVPDTLLPTHPIGVWQGQALVADTLILVPAYSRVRVQMAVPFYATGVNTSSWGVFPWDGNVWSLHLEILEATR